VNWYSFAILSLILMGAQRFLYKVSAERNCNTVWTTFSFMATVALLSSVLCFVLKVSIDNIRFLLFIALVNSAAFLVGTINHIEALKHIPAAIAYPLIRLNAVVVVVFSVLFFRDRLSASQILGIILAVAVMVILTRDNEGKQALYGNKRRGLISVGIALLCGSIASISSKFAVLYTDKLAFMAASYAMATLFSLTIRNRLQTEPANPSHKDALLIGFVMGIINFAGYYSFLRALSTGPLSIIVSITGMYFMIAIILSVLIYRETLTPLRILGISLSVVSIVLLRF